VSDLTFEPPGRWLLCIFHISEVFMTPIPQASGFVTQPVKVTRLVWSTFLVAVVMVVLFYYVTTWHTPVGSAVLLQGHPPPAVAVKWTRPTDRPLNATETRVDIDFGRSCCDVHSALQCLVPSHWLIFFDSVLHNILKCTLLALWRQRFI